jgi:SAM-dependent methyltransferase
MIVPNDIIIQASKNGKWIIYNVFSRNTIAVKTETLEIISLIDLGTKISDIISENESKEFKVWNIERFSNFDGLLADPSRIIRDSEKWPESMDLGISQLIDILKQKNIIIEDYDKYLDMFESKRSLLDNEHFGNFHQQLGQKMLIEKKINPDDWWISQKFERDISSIKNNLYKSIQESFLEEFFEKKLSANDTILDLGCGVGYYSKLMAKTKSKVIGVDPNKQFIDIARKKSEEVEFQVSEIGNADSLDWLEENSVDFVFMSDALLFYFVPPNPKQKFEIQNLLTSIKRVLKKNGRLFSLEPHGIFFLKPWLGEIDNPFTIITEYNRKKFDITPNLNQVIKSFLKGGFILRDFKELYGKEGIIEDRRAESFAKEFPLWWFFELEPEK